VTHDEAEIQAAGMNQDPLQPLSAMISSSGCGSATPACASSTCSGAAIAVSTIVVVSPWSDPGVKGMPRRLRQIGGRDPQRVLFGLSGSDGHVTRSVVHTIDSGDRSMAHALTIGLRRGVPFTAGVR
jgi:hypothetical protein